MSEPLSRALAVCRHPEFRRGALDVLGPAIGLGAWGLVSGVAMKSVLGAGLAALMGLLVYAGSSQLAALPLIAAGAPIWVVWTTAFCVNLRFVIFSAQWRPYVMHLSRWQRLAFGYFAADMNFVLFIRRYPKPEPGPGQMPYYLGGVITNWVCWQVPLLLGIVLADIVPTQWGIGFAGTLALLALTCSLLTDRVTWVAAAVAACAAVAAYAWPLRLNIICAIAAAVAIGLLIDSTRPATAVP